MLKSEQQPIIHEVCHGYLKVLVPSTHQQSRRWGDFQSNVSVFSLTLDLFSAGLLPAEACLRDKEAGAFVIRDSTSFRGSFGLAMKVDQSPTSAGKPSMNFSHRVVAFVSWIKHRCLKVSESLDRLGIKVHVCSWRQIRSNNWETSSCEILRWDSADVFHPQCTQHKHRTSCLWPCERWERWENDLWGHVGLWLDYPVTGLSLQDKKLLKI